MKPQKYSLKNSEKIDLGAKTIFKYPTPTKDFDVARMVVNGRHPKDPKKFIIEHDCNFVIYVIKGSGKVYAGGKTFDVQVDDVVFVPKENKFAVEGKMEYITFDSPAFYLEQFEEVE